MFRYKILKQLKMMHTFLTKMELIESIERYCYSITRSSLHTKKSNREHTLKHVHLYRVHISTNKMKTIHKHIRCCLHLCLCLWIRIIMNGSNHNKSIEQFWKIILPLSHFLCCTIKRDCFMTFSKLVRRSCTLYIGVYLHV